ncbi:MAG TPA: (Fe-S)-binding protein, partial [Acidobacteria bacterium]|nr:(Fe-S)-binding protein [Acidobacteriota bacterium]
MEFQTWESVLVALLVVIAATSFLRDLGRKLALIRKGNSDRPRTDRLGHRLLRVLTEVLLQSRVIGGRPVVGAMHAAVFGGFLFFGLETLDHFLEPFGVGLLDPLLGPAVPAFKALLSLWAVVVIAGITGLALRRFVFVRFSPDPKSYSSGLVALLIILLMATFLYARTEPSAGLEKANWWAHALGILVFPGLILRSKHFHIVMAPFSVFFRTHRLGEILPLDLDLETLEESGEEFSLGLEKLSDLSWKQRMDFLTCVECRRCTDNCPAALAGQSLDPRGFILQGRRAISAGDDEQPVVGPVISETALGQCTSCGACENICPVGVEHLQVLTGAKRAQALASGTGMVAADFLNEVERTGNALGAPTADRRRLVEEESLPVYEAGRSEVLLWMGCIWNYNPQARPAVRAMARVLDAAGVRWGVLESEKCSGHHSRRQGEEMQFQTLAG